MNNPSRWTKLWKAVVRWWKNKPPIPVTDELLDNARTFLRDYDDIYTRRNKLINPSYSAQAAEAIFQEGHKRAPTLESEVRTLALILERVVGHLELERERERSVFGISNM